MRIDNGRHVFAPTDLTTFLGCRYATTIALAALDAPRTGVRLADPMGELVKQKGLEHEQGMLVTLRLEYSGGVAEIPASGSFSERQAATNEALASGVPVVYQAALGHDGWAGYADFLIRDGAEMPPRYEPYDTKLARSAAPSHVVQLSVYADLLAGSPRAPPRNVHVLLGDGSRVSLPVADVVHYVRRARTRFEDFCVAPPALSPDPCPACVTCDHAAGCEAEWEEAEHLSLVANIRKDQIRKLEGHGITTLPQLASLPDGTTLRGLVPETLGRLVTQARLQHRFRTTGERCHELIDAREGRGFARLPRPDPHDLFLDLEGDPLHPGGLEYLIGILGQDEAGEPRFSAFWAHDHEAERIAFETAVDAIDAVLRARPGAYIYHYAAYEVTAFRRLACRYGTREAVIDDWLRRHRFVNLYAVVREAIRISEPRYSLKNVELFFAPEREEEVTSAGGSIVEYERWRQLRDPGGAGAVQRAGRALDTRSSRLAPHPPSD